eukprot:g4135.t1
MMKQFSISFLLKLTLLSHYFSFSKGELFEPRFIKVFELEDEEFDIFAPDAHEKVPISDNQQDFSDPFGNQQDFSDPFGNKRFIYTEEQALANAEIPKPTVPVSSGEISSHVSQGSRDFGEADADLDIFQYGKPKKKDGEKTVQLFLLYSYCTAILAVFFAFIWQGMSSSSEDKRYMHAFVEVNVTLNEVCKLLKHRSDGEILLFLFSRDKKGKVVVGEAKEGKEGDVETSFDLVHFVHTLLVDIDELIKHAESSKSVKYTQSKKYKLPLGAKRLHEVGCVCSLLGDAIIMLGKVLSKNQKILVTFLSYPAVFEEMPILKEISVDDFADFETLTKRIKELRQVGKSLVERSEKLHKEHVGIQKRLHDAVYSDNVDTAAALRLCACAECLSVLIDADVLKVCDTLKERDDVARSCEVALTKALSIKEVNSDSFIVIAELRSAVEAAQASGHSQLSSVIKAAAALNDLEDSMELKISTKPVSTADDVLAIQDKADNSGNNVNSIVSTAPQEGTVENDDGMSMLSMGGDGTGKTVKFMVTQAIEQFGLEEEEARRVVFDRMLAHDIEMKKLQVRQKAENEKWKRKQRALQRRDSERRIIERKKWREKLKSKRENAEKQAKEWDIRRREQRIQHEEILALSKQQHESLVMERRTAQRSAARDLFQRKQREMENELNSQLWYMTSNLIKADFIIILILDIALFWESLHTDGLFADQCGVALEPNEPATESGLSLFAESNMIAHFVSKFFPGMTESVCYIVNGFRIASTAFGVLLSHAIVSRVAPDLSFVTILLSFIRTSRLLSTHSNMLRRINLRRQQLVELETKHRRSRATVESAIRETSERLRIARSNGGYYSGEQYNTDLMESRNAERDRMRLERAIDAEELLRKERLAEAVEKTEVRLKEGSRELSENQLQHRKAKILDTIRSLVSAMDKVHGLRLELVSAPLRFLSRYTPLLEATGITIRRLFREMHKKHIRGDFFLPSCDPGVKLSQSLFCEGIRKLKIVPMPSNSEMRTLFRYFDATSNGFVSCGIVRQRAASNNLPTFENISKGVFLMNTKVQTYNENLDGRTPLRSWSGALQSSMSWIHGLRRFENKRQNKFENKRKYQGRDIWKKGLLTNQDGLLSNVQMFTSPHDTLSDTDNDDDNYNRENIKIEEFNSLNESNASARIDSLWAHIQHLQVQLSESNKINSDDIAPWLASIDYFGTSSSCIGRWQFAVDRLERFKIKSRERNLVENGMIKKELRKRVNSKKRKATKNSGKGVNKKKSKATREEMIKLREQEIKNYINVLRKQRLQLSSKDVAVAALAAVSAAKYAHTIANKVSKFIVEISTPAFIFRKFLNRHCLKKCQNLLIMHSLMKHEIRESIKKRRVYDAITRKMNKLAKLNTTDRIVLLEKKSQRLFLEFRKSKYKAQREANNFEKAKLRLLASYSEEIKKILEKKFKGLLLFDYQAPPQLTSEDDDLDDMLKKAYNFSTAETVVWDDENHQYNNGKEDVVEVEKTLRNMLHDEKDLALEKWDSVNGKWIGKEDKVESVESTSSQQVDDEKNSALEKWDSVNGKWIGKEDKVESVESTSSQKVDDEKNSALEKWDSVNGKWIGKEDTVEVNETS